MLRILQIAVFVVCVTNICEGKSCIKSPGQNKCTQGSNDCDTENTQKVCMNIENGKSGKYKSLCGLPQAEGCLCDKDLVTSEACQSGLSCQEVDGKHKCTQTATTAPVCDPEGRHWELIYHNGPKGAALDNTNIQNLITALEAGAEIKVWTIQFGLTNVQKASIAHDEDILIKTVHGQSLFWAPGSANGAFNMFYIFSTNGNVHMTQFFIGNPENSGRVNTNINSEMKWFIRNLSPNAKVTDTTQLFTSVRDGASVRVASECEIRHLEVADIDNDRVQGISIWEMRDRQNGIEFNNTEQWLLQRWSDDGQVMNTSWLVNNHTMEEAAKLQNVDIDWYVDVCWSLVYKSSKNGKGLYGTKSSLTSAINEGKRVKVSIGTKFFEPNSVRITDNGDVVIHVYDSVDFDITQGKWRWMDVSTTGEVITYVVDIGDGTDVTPSSVNDVVSWFIENRDWENVTDASEIGARMNQAIGSGSDVRFSVPIGTDTVWYQADFVRPGLGAYNEREVVYLPETNKYVRRYSHAYWTRGVKYGYMDFAVGTNVQEPYQSPTAKSITWYFG